MSLKEFSHIGIPSAVKRDGEIYLEDAKLYITDFSQSANLIEWLRFEEGSPMPTELQSVAHVAFNVEDLDEALAGQEVLIEPFEPMAGLKVAFILEDGAPVELMQEL